MATYTIPSLQDYPQTESALRWELCLAADDSFSGVLRIEYGPRASEMRYRPHDWTDRVRWRWAALEMARADYRAACERDGQRPYL